MPPNPPSNTNPASNGEKLGATAVSVLSFPSTNHDEASSPKPISSSSNGLSSAAPPLIGTSPKILRKPVEVEEQTKTMLIPDYDDDDDVIDNAVKNGGNQNGGARGGKDYSFANGTRANGEVAPVIFSGMAAKRLLLQQRPPLGGVEAGSGKKGEESGDIIVTLPEGEAAGYTFNRQVELLAKLCERFK